MALKPSSPDPKRPNESEIVSIAALSVSGVCASQSGGGAVPAGTHGEAGGGSWRQATAEAKTTDRQHKYRGKRRTKDLDAARRALQIAPPMR
jgi:hypothetical protein